MKKSYYIAYGSNLNVRQMKFRCPNAVPIGTAEIKGYELLFKGSKTGSYLTIEPKKNGTVPVAVWEVSATDESSLDCYEGYPTFYYKTEMTLPVKDINSGKVAELTAFVYIMHENRPLGVPTESYMETCLDGYRSFGFNKEYIRKALRESRGF